MEQEIDIENTISTALRSRLADFKEQADSLTLEGVRRVLEKDMGMKAFSLDPHKRFIKQRLEEYFSGPEDENISKNSAEKSEDAPSVKSEDAPSKTEDTAKECERPPAQNEDQEKIEGLAALEGKKSTKQESKDSPGTVKLETVLNEDIIKRAIKNKARYFAVHSESITFSGARRLLEEDLKLEQNALDTYKKFIREQLDEIFQGPAVVESANGSKEKRPQKVSSNKQPKKADSEDGSSGPSSSDEEVGEEHRKRKKRPANKGVNTERVKKRKKSAKESKLSSDVEEASTKGNETAEDCENSSEDGRSQSSAEKSVKKRTEVSAPVYGKKVEHLKSVIKACGMSVPPAVYKRVKQAPESKREGRLIKELEEILGKEGLSANSSEKEIKAVRKRKERAKDLEGIDMSNIVSDSRSRRAVSNFMMPPMPSKPVKTDDNDDADDDGEDDDEGEEDNDEGTDDGTDDGDSDDASEGFDEDDEDESN